MDNEKLKVVLRKVMEKKQGLYSIFTELADTCVDNELMAHFGHIAYEEKTSLCTLLDNYKNIVDAELAVT